MMNSDTLQGQWKQLRGSVKEAFGKLTDDDFIQADGNADKMVGSLQKRYGYTKEQAQNEWTKFVNKYGNKANDAKGDFNAAAKDAKSAAGHVKDATRR
jgi:uncharacterized protein YjbJ (UPF0337 family)